MIRLILHSQLSDPEVNENFKRLEAERRSDALAKAGFQFLDLSFKNNVTRLKVPHGLGFVPLDVIPLSIRQPDTAAVTWHYDSFDATNLVVSVSGTSYATTGKPTLVRAYVGRYSENT